jgi:hypothetical protein
MGHWHYTEHHVPRVLVRPPAPARVSPNAVFVSTMKLSPDGLARLRERWRQAYEGNAHRVMILESDMSLTTANLANALRAGVLSPNEARRLMMQPPLAQMLPPLPLPFCWGPNGAFYLLGALLAAYGLIVAALSAV